MTLDDELRSTLREEATRRTAPPPFVEDLLSGGRARRRHRTMARTAAGLAATVLLGAATYGLVQGGSPRERTGQDVVSPPGVTSWAADSAEVVAPGTYRMVVGRGAGGGLLQADVTLEGGTWRGGDFARVSSTHGSSSAGFGAYQPRELASGDGCGDGPVTSAEYDTPADLAGKLATLPRSRVLAAPTATEAFGREAIHLRLRIDVECPGFYRVAHAPTGTRGLTYPADPASGTPNVIIDFWVLEVDGTLVVVDLWHNRDAPDDLVRRAATAKDSIRFLTD